MDKFDVMNARSITDYCRRLDAGRNQNDPVIEDCDGNQIRRGEYWDRVTSYSQYLLSKGIDFGDTLAICCKNTPEYEFAYFGALDNGTVASTTSIAFLKHNLLKETVKKGAKTLMLSAEYIREYPEELREAFKALGDNTDAKRLERIIFTSAGTYRKEANAAQYDAELNAEELIKSLDLPSNIEIVQPGEMKKFHEGKLIYIPSNRELMSLMNEVSTYSNTGGTSLGVPKCAVHKHRAMAELVKTQVDGKHPIYQIEPGTRSLILIPISHITSQYYSLLTRVAQGALRVYDPEAFEPAKITQRIINSDIKDFTAPFGLINALVHSPEFQEAKKDKRMAGTQPLCGGEATPFIPTKKVQEEFVEAGVKRMIIGGGSTEKGSVTMSSHYVEDRINETGTPFPGVTIEIIDPKTGYKVTPGNPGIIYESTPWQMDRYLGNSEATRNFFHYTNADGKVLGTNNDIGIEVGKTKQGYPIYSMIDRVESFIVPTSSGKRYVRGVTIVDGKVQSTLDGPIDLKKGAFLAEFRDELLSVPGIVEAAATLVPYEEESKEGTLVGYARPAIPQAVGFTLNALYGTDAKSGFHSEGVTFITGFNKNIASDKPDPTGLPLKRDGHIKLNDEGETVSTTLPMGGDPQYTRIDPSAITVELAPPPALTKTKGKN